MYDKLSESGFSRLNDIQDFDKIQPNPKFLKILIQTI